MNIIIAYILGIITCIIINICYHLYLMHNDRNIIYDNYDLIILDELKSVDENNIVNNVSNINNNYIINKDDIILFPLIDYDILLEKTIEPETNYINDDIIDNIFIDKQSYTIININLNNNINNKNKILNFKSNNIKEKDNIDLSKILLKSLNNNNYS